MIISIPIKPYLKDFLVNIYGQEPIPTSKKNIIGILVEPILKKPPVDYIPQQTISKPDNILIEIIKCKKKKELEKNPLYYHYISLDDQLKLQRGILNIFNHIFYTFTDSYILAYSKGNIKYEIKNCIDDFCNEYDINKDNADYEMLKKNYYRYRIKKNDANCPL